MSGSVETIIGTSIAVIAGVAAAVLWVRNTASALRREMEQKLQALDGDVDVRLREARDNADRVYAKREDMSAMTSEMHGMRDVLRDIQQHVHELSKNMMRRRSYTPRETGGE